MKILVLFAGFVFVTLNVFAGIETQKHRGSNAEEALNGTIDEDLRMVSRPIFLPVKAGTFKMGSPKSENGRNYDEVRYSVTLKRDFEIGVTEVTQLQWFNVMGSNPSYFNEEKYCPDSYMEEDGVPLCPSLPVEKVSYSDVKDFIEAYNNRAKEEGGSYTYRLPTETEWEYAARGGTTTAYSFGDDPLDLVEYGWHKENLWVRARRGGSFRYALIETVMGSSQPVATKKPNPLGLYDVHGNVWEWVADSGSFSLVTRGGGWASYALLLRSANRRIDWPGDRYSDVGFRLVRTPKN